MNNEDKKFLWNLMPDWVKKMEPGLCPTMYGTGTYSGDRAVLKKVKELIGNAN